MITFLILVAIGVLAYITINQFMKSGKTEKSIDLGETLLPKEDIHAEIAKTVEEIKSQEPIVAEKVVEAKPKKKAAPKKKEAAPKTAPKPKMKATPKKGK